MDYAQVHVSYSHSAFPCHPDSNGMGGISKVQSTMKTVAVATLKQCNQLSPWSPSPAPAPNGLFSLVAQHWGSGKANEAMQKMLTQKSTPRKAAKSGEQRAVDRFPSKAVLERSSEAELPATTTIEQWIGDPSDRNFGRKSDAPGHLLSPGLPPSASVFSTSRGGNRSDMSCSLDPSHSDLSGLSYHSGMYRGEPSETSSLLRRTGGLRSIPHFFPDTISGVTSSRGSRNKTISGARRKETSRWAWASWF